MFKYFWPTALFGCLLIFVNHSCKSTKPLTPEHQHKLSFGSYGGFAGSFKEFVLVPNGQVFLKKRFGAEYQELHRISQNQCSQFFETIKSFEVLGLEQNQSGNLTNFIKYSSDGVEKIQWSWPAGSEIDKRIEILFKNLRAVCIETAPIM